jgi:hypothetical protein
MNTNALRLFHFKSCRFSSLLPASKSPTFKTVEDFIVLFLVEKEVADAWIFHQK